MLLDIRCACLRVHAPRGTGEHLWCTSPLDTLLDMLSRAWASDIFVSTDCSMFLSAYKENFISNYEKSI